MRGAGSGAPLLGRDRELEALTGVLRRVRSGTAGIAFLEGEPGIGKTRLLEEALKAAVSPAVPVLRATARELERRRPFASITDALGVHLSSPEPERERLARLVLNDGGGVRRSFELDVGADVRYQVVEAVVEHVERRALAGPLILAFEDLHWADPSTVLTVHALARRLSDVPVAVIATFRPSGATRDIDRVVEEVVGEGVAHVVLEPLDDDAIAALAEAVTGAAPGQQLLKQLGRARGNPLFVIELLRALVDEHGVTLSAGQAELARFSLPPSLRPVLLRRFSHVSATTLEILKLASVLGSSFEVARLALVARRSSVELAPLLEEALRAGILREAGTRLAFRHDLVREAMYEDVPGPVRAGLHLEAAWVLADAGADPSEVAEHLTLGAGPGDRRAIEWLHDAARHVLPLAPASAAELLERALALADPPHPGRDRLLADLVVARMWSGAVRQAEELARKLLSRPHDPSVAMSVHLVLIDALALQGRVREMTAETELALGQQGLPGGVRAQLRALAAAGALYQGQPERAVVAAEEARREGEEGGDETAVCFALAVLGFIALVEARAGDAIVLLTDALARSERSASKASLRSTYSPYILLGLALAEADRPEAAIRTFQDGLGQSERLGFAGNLPLFHWGLAQFYLLTGRWDDALVEAEAGFDLARDVGAGMGSTMAHVAVALIAFHRNELDRSERELALAEAAFATFGPHFVFDWLEVARALLCEARGDRSRALTILEHGWERRVEGGVAVDLPFLGPDLVRLSLASGHVEAAAAVANQVDEVAGRLRTPSAGVAALRCRGALEQDVELLLGAVALSRQVARPLEQASACEDAADALSRCSRLPEALQLLTEAASIYEHLGAARDLARVESRLRSLGVRKGRRGRRPPRPSSGPQSLTGTERDVVRLLTEGLTNREIAQRMFVSPRTVECHLSHVFRKLGLASRAALRAEARQWPGAANHEEGVGAVDSAARRL